MFNKKSKEKSSAQKRVHEEVFSGGERGADATPGSSKKVDDKKTPPKAISMADLTPELEELDDDTLDAIALSNTDGTKQSYANVAKKKSMDQQFLLYIQNGHVRREPITRSLFEAFMEELQNHIWTLDANEAAKIKIAWNDFHLGHGLVACLDNYTTAYIKKYAEAFNLEGSTLRAWARADFGERVVFSGFLHGKLWTRKKGPQALSTILKRNELDGKFQLLSYQARPKGVFLRFEPDNELDVSLGNHGYAINAGTCRLVLTKKVTKAGAAATTAAPEDEANTSD